jgi:hypothetical protein
VHQAVHWFSCNLALSRTLSQVAYQTTPTALEAARMCTSHAVHTVAATGPSVSLGLRASTAASTCTTDCWQTGQQRSYRARCYRVCHTTRQWQPDGTRHCALRTRGTSALVSVPLKALHVRIAAYILWNKRALATHSNSVHASAHVSTPQSYSPPTRISGALRWQRQLVRQRQVQEQRKSVLIRTDTHVFRYTLR